MDKTQLTYIVFAAVVFLALLFDLGLLSKKIKKSPWKRHCFKRLFGYYFPLPFVALYGMKILGVMGRKMPYNIFRLIYWNGH